MATVTENYYIEPSDGWVEIADGYEFIRVSGVPHSHPYYLYGGASAPSLDPTLSTGSFTFAAGGGPVDGEYVEIGDEVYTFKTTAVDPFDVELQPVGSTGSIIIAGGVPSDTDTVTIDTETYTFVTSATNPFEVTIGTDEDETGENLASVINTDSQIVAASNTGGTVTITSLGVGASTNYALSESADNTTVSGANMTGGLDNDYLLLAPVFANVVNQNSQIVHADESAGVVTLTGLVAPGGYALSAANVTDVTASGTNMSTFVAPEEGVLCCHHPFEVNVVSTEKLFARVVNPVPNSKNRDGTLRIDVFKIEP
jgi:hypothetical protein